MFLSFFLRLVSSFKPLGSKMLDMIQFSWTGWGLFCVLPCGLSLKTIHVHLKGMGILLLWGAMFYKYQLSLFDLECQCHNILVDVLFGRSIHCEQWGVTILYNDCIAVPIFLKSSRIFFIYVAVPILGAYMFTRAIPSCWTTPLGIMKWPYLSLVMAFVLKSILSDIRIATPAFFHVHLHGKKFFLSLHFHPLRIFCSKIHGNWNWKWPRSGTLFSNFHLSPHHHYIKLTPLINKSSSN